MSFKITKELRSDLVQIAVNLDCFSDRALGILIRGILIRELTKIK